MLPILFSSHLCHPVRSTHLVYVHAIVPFLFFLGFAFSGSFFSFNVLLYTVDLLNVFGVLLEISKLAVSTVLDGCCLGLSQFETKTDDQFVIHIVSHYFDLYYTVMHVLLETYNIYFHRFTL